MLQIDFDFESLLNAMSFFFSFFFTKFIRYNYFYR